MRLSLHPEAKKNISIKVKKYYVECPDVRKRASETTKKQWLDPKFIEAKSRKVICLETGKIYNSIKEAYTTLKISRTGIIKSCQNNKRTAGNYHWAYYFDNMNVEPKIFPKKSGNHSRKVQCLDTGEIFNSAVDASKKMGVNKTKIF